MKKCLIVFFLAVIAFSVTAQINFGVRAGMNINNFNIKSEYYRAQELGLGFTGGLFLRLTAGDYFLEPDLMYSRRNSSFTYSPQQNIDTVFNTNRSYLDLPIHFGKEFFNVISISTGPVFSLKLSEVAEYYTTNQNQKTKIINEVFQKRNLGWQIGAGINSGLFMIDFRYEWGFGVFQSFNLPGLISDFNPDGNSHSLQVILAMKFISD